MSKHSHRWRKPITPSEASEMQNMRDLGSNMVEIALAFDCTINTVSKHTKLRAPRLDRDKRNEKLICLVEGRTHDEREFIARRYGFAGYASLKVVLSQFRRKQRQHAGAEA